MSILTAKHVLFLSNQNSTAVKKFSTVLAGQQMSVEVVQCQAVDIEFFNTHIVDIIFIDLTIQDELCKKVLHTFALSDSIRHIPIIAVVPDADSVVQDALNLGAADYVIEDEDPYLMLDKVRTLFAQPQSVSQGSMIDITPIEPSVSDFGTRVYVVEDDPLLQNLLSIRLQKSNFPFAFSRDGQHILAAVKDFNPDVIILDLMLPGVSGIDVLKSIRGDESTKDIPVIIFSNRDNIDDRHVATELGVSGYFIKALTDLTDLIETIQSVTAK